MLSFIKQFFIYGLSSILGKILAIFLIPLYTSIFTTTEYGALALLTSCKGLIDIFSNLNIHAGIARHYYDVEEQQRSRLVSTGAYSIAICSLLTLTILLSSSSFWLKEVLDIAEFKHAFVVVLLTIPANSLLSYFSTITRLKKMAITYSIGTLLQLLVQTAVSITLVVGYRIGISGMFYGLLSAEIFGIIYLYIVNRKEIILSFCRRYLLDALKFSLPTLPGIAGIWIDTSLGQIIIGKYISLSNLGVYSLALQISSLFLLLQVAIRSIWTPFIYENYKAANFNSQVRLIFSTITWLFIFMILNISILSKEIILILSSPNYLDASLYLPLLSLAYGLNILSSIAEVGSNITKNTKIISVAYLSGALCNLTLLWLLVPSFGIIVIPLSLITSRLICFSILNLYNKRGLEILLPFEMILLFMVAAALSYTLSLLELRDEIRYTTIILIDVIFVVVLNRKYNIRASILKLLKV